MYSYSSGSRKQTVEIGLALAGLLRAGDVVVFSGELGAGKTALASGVIEGLGSSEPVTSPTFTIMRHHRLGTSNGSFVTPQVLHLDAYRLSGPGDAEDIGLLELLDEGAIAVIEWGERIVDVLGPSWLHVTLHQAQVGATSEDTTYGEDARLITVVGVGARWSDVDLTVLDRTVSTKNLGMSRVDTCG